MKKRQGQTASLAYSTRSAGPTVKQDLTSALQQLFNLRADRWNLLNSANIALLPKKDGADTAADYRPISLMHGVTKIMGKVLTNRLAPHLPKLVSNSQSAFIKGRSILDNFQYIQGAVNHYHKAKTPMLFVKLDIAKVFDSVRWEYMLEVMQRLGFGQRWHDLISIIWSKSTSRVLLNGRIGTAIQHKGVTAR